MKKIDGKMLKNMIISGANTLQMHKNEVNELNVFPVPDGDTGTNMALTVLAVAKEVSKLDDSATICEVAKIASSAALRGARGNSGVILSQIFRGISNGLTDKKEATVQDLAIAFSEAANSAYKAVMKPKEGTILTIVRVFGEKLNEEVEKYTDIKEYLKVGMNHANEILDQTPDMLAELKQAGVVDAGGKGFLYIIEGFISGISNTKLDINSDTESDVSLEKIKSMENVNINLEYCTEFILDRKLINQSEFKNLDSFLKKNGDSIVLAEDDNLVKVHVHTNNPGKVLEEGLKMGRLITIKIENMKEQHENIIVNEQLKKEEKKQEPRKSVGFISVATGEGLESVMLDLGCDHVVNGGQSMNPSTEDLVSAVENVNADNIIILPNNKNIIMAAKQVADVVTDKKIHVIDTVNIPQGIMSLITYNVSDDIEKNIKKISSNMKKIKSAEVTYAVRNTTIGNKKIHENDILGIVQGEIQKVGKDLEKTVIDTIGAMIDEDSEIVSIYYGEGIEEEKAKNIKNKIEEKHKNCEVELQYGGQPVYYYIISVE